MQIVTLEDFTPQGQGFGVALQRLTSRLLVTVRFDMPVHIRREVVLLHSTDARERQWAAFRLGQMGADAAPAIPFLVAILGDKPDFYHTGWPPPPQPGEAAARALVKIGDASLGPLIAVLKTGTPIARAHAALALGEMREPLATTLLAQALRSGNEVLSGNEWELRFRVAEALGKIATVEALAVLNEALQDPDPDTRGIVRNLGFPARALEKMPVPASVEAWTAALEDKDSDVRRSAAQALGRIDDAAAVELLLAAARTEQDSRSQERIWWPLPAQKALNGVRAPTAISRLLAGLADSDWRVRSAAAEALGHTGGSEGADALLVCLKDEHETVRSLAADALGSIGYAPAVEPLAACLGDEVREVRSSAAWALAQIGDPRGLESVIGDLAQPSEFARRTAAWRLGRLGDRRAVDALATALKSDPKASVRQFAAVALGEIGDADAVDALILALADDSDSIRQYAVEALREIGDPRAAGALARLVRQLDRMPCLREALTELGDIWALQPLLALFADACEYDAFEMQAEVADVLTGICRRHQDVTDAVIAALTDGSPAARRAAAWVMAEIKDVRAVDPLLSALRTEPWEVRWHAAEALGKIGDARALPELIAALRDEQRTVREAAAEALGALGDSRGTAALIRALRDRAEGVRCHAVRALGKIGDARARRALRAASRDKHASVRAATVHALGTMKDAHSARLLQRALRDGHPAVRLIAALALAETRDPGLVWPLSMGLFGIGSLEHGMEDAISFALDFEERQSLPERVSDALALIGAPGLSPLIAALRDRDPKIRVIAAEALAKIRSPIAVSPLPRALQDADPYHEVAVALAQALAQIGDMQAVGPLIDTLGHERPRVRQAAAQALRELSHEDFSEDQERWREWSQHAGLTPQEDASRCGRQPPVKPA